MKKYIALTISVLLMICGIDITSYAVETEFVVTASAVCVTNAQSGADLIVALYHGTQLTGVKTYNGMEGTISADYADDMKEQMGISDSIKAFLWNVKTLEPLIKSYSNQINNLPIPAPPAEKPNRVLTVYFSCTNNTKNLAQKIARVAESDIYEIVPEEPYTSEDLNYNSDCRANREQNDANARPAIAGKVENMKDYDVILLGYPIWWGQAPKIIYTFLESYDMNGKTIMPFCTSGSTGISGSLQGLRSVCPDSTVTAGFRGTVSTADTQIQSWLDSNNFSSAIAKRIRLTAGGNEIIIKLEDNNTANSLAAMLPLNLNFEDYNGTEKIAYLTEQIDSSDAPEGITPEKGDFTLYVLWGNLALFYQDFRYSSGLVSIGKVEIGLEHITSLAGTVTAELY